MMLVYDISDISGGRESESTPTNQRLWTSTSKRGRNRPVLLHAEKRQGRNGMRRHITESEAVQELGFKSLWVWRDDLNTNVQAVEAALQRVCDDLELGVRLHRVSGAGKGIKHPSFEGSGVYITFSDTVQNKIDAGEVVVNH